MWGVLKCEYPFNILDTPDIGNLFSMKQTILGHPTYLGISLQYVLKCSWMVCFMENPNLQWMMTRGTLILGNLSMGSNNKIESPTKGKD